MFVNKSRNPSASEILSQLFLNKELRSRVLTTLALLLLVRLGSKTPLNNARAAMVALSQLRTHKSASRERGILLEQLYS